MSIFLTFTIWPSCITKLVGMRFQLYKFPNICNYLMNIQFLFRSFLLCCVCVYMHIAISQEITKSHFSLFFYQKKLLSSPLIRASMLPLHMHGCRYFSLTVIICHINCCTATHHATAHCYCLSCLCHYSPVQVSNVVVCEF